MFETKNTTLYSCFSTAAGCFFRTKNQTILITVAYTHLDVYKRQLVLCPDHVNDLLLTSQAFREQYNIDRNSGKVGNLYGFEIYEYGNNY